MLFSALQGEHQLATDQQVYEARRAPVEESIALSQQDSLCAVRPVPQPLRIGGAQYYFTERVAGWFNPASGEFKAFGLPFVSGTGGDPETACRDWGKSFHAAFQTLVFTRDFELGPEDLRRKRQLAKLVDVVRYRNTIPYSLQKIGQVDQARPYPSRIRWLDGSTFPIDYDTATDPGLAGLRVGQWIEAQVKVTPVTHRVIRIAAFTRLQPGAPSTGALPKTLLDLPKSEARWTE